MLDQIGLWQDTAWYVQLIFNLLLFALPTLAGLAALSKFGALTIQTARDVWTLLRPALDQPTDRLIMEIARRVGADPTEVSEFLTRNIDGVIMLLPDKMVKINAFERPQIVKSSPPIFPRRE